MKKVLKDIEYFTLEELENGTVDMAVTVNGVDLIDMPIDEGIKILRDNNLIKNEAIIIPAGLELTSIEDFGATYEYNFGNGFIVLDLCFNNDDEDEYIG
jgi:hypothetical protein